MRLYGKRTRPEYRNPLRTPPVKPERQRALLESDPQNVESKILAAETAIFVLFQELASVNGEATDERRALNDALHTMRALQVAKLHYPRLPGEALQQFTNCRLRCVTGGSVLLCQSAPVYRGTGCGHVQTCHNAIFRRAENVILSGLLSG